MNYVKTFSSSNTSITKILKLTASCSNANLTHLYIGRPTYWTYKFVESVLCKSSRHLVHMQQELYKAVSLWSTYILVHTIFSYLSIYFPYKNIEVRTINIFSRSGCGHPSLLLRHIRSAYYFFIDRKSVV